MFTSDNGGSREGEAEGTSAYLRTLHFGRTGTEEPFDEDLARLDEMGGPTTFPHYPRGWAMASNTPFRLYKINAHRGGHSVPFIVSWPAGGVPAGELRDQFVHVTDLLPTLLDLVGVERPTTWRGQPALALAGQDVGAALFDAGAEGRTNDVVIENEGHRGYRRGRWEAVTRHEALTSFADEPWELYDMSRRPDPGERPGRRGAGAARRADRGVGRRGVGQPDLPARRGHRATATCSGRPGRSATTARSCSVPTPRRSTAGGHSA